MASVEWECFFCKSINTEIADSCDFCGNVQPPASWVEKYEVEMKENRESAKRQAAARRALAAKEATEKKAPAAARAGGSGVRAREYAHDGPRAPSKARVVGPDDRLDTASDEQLFTKATMQKHVFGMLTSYLDGKSETRSKLLASDAKKMNTIAENIVARCFEENAHLIVEGGKRSDGEPRITGKVWKEWFDNAYEGEAEEVNPPFWAALFCGTLDDADRRAFVTAFFFWVMALYYLYFFWIHIKRSGGVVVYEGASGAAAGRAAMEETAHSPSGSDALAPAVDDYDYGDSF